MSQENVEMVKAVNAALNTGDLESAWASFAPVAEMQDLLSGPDQPTVVKGRAPFERYGAFGWELSMSFVPMSSNT